MIRREWVTSNSALCGITWALALVMPVDMGTPAVACDSDKTKAEDVVVRLVGDKRVEAELTERLARLEDRLRDLQRDLDQLSQTLVGIRGKHDGRTGVDFFAPSGSGKHFTPAPPALPDLPGWAAPAMPSPPTPPTPPTPPAPPVWKAPHSGDTGAYEEALEHFREAREEWQERWQDRYEDWQERHEEWQERQAEVIEEWRERQSEMAERWHERQAEAMERWHEHMEDWREHQHEATQQWRGNLHQLQEHGEQWRDRLGELEMPEALESAEDVVRSLGIAIAKPDRHRIVYDVTGEHADLLFTWLAPSDVKVIVSRAGKHIAVQGTECEHEVLNAGLQLLNWIDRGKVFQRMTQGERTDRTYHELGSKQADMLYDALAPDDVKVVVSRPGSDCVSILGTDREHRVISDFLALLHWTHDEKTTAKHKAKSGRVEADLKRAQEKVKRSAEKRKRTEDKARRTEERRDRPAKDKRKRAQAKSSPQGSRFSAVYDVTGQHADDLYEVLAPQDVQVIVSRAGENIAVSGTKREHATINAVLQLMNWIDRDEVFERMTRGERTPRTYRLGAERAEKVYDALAPNDVQVVVSHEGTEAVSILGTDREHKVISDFLDLLRWTGKKTATKSARPRPKAAARPAVEERIRDQVRSKVAEMKGDKRGRIKNIVYDVTGKRADMLYKLLAPSDVKAIVSRAGENISVTGTKQEHVAINAGLQLLSWIDRDEVFEEMIQGERHSRTYELGEKRAQLLYQMLAPNDVKVVVSHTGDDAVSVSATDREHEALAGFLGVLNWMH